MSAAIRVRFAPKPDITAFELASMIANGWPVLVDTASGEGSMMLEMNVTRTFWDHEIVAAFKRHFEEVV